MLAGFCHNAPRPGYASPVEMSGMPLLIVRDHDEEARVFHQVCRHPGRSLSRNPVNAFRCWPVSTPPGATGSTSPCACVRTSSGRRVRRTRYPGTRACPSCGLAQSHVCRHLERCAGFREPPGAVLPAHSELWLGYAENWISASGARIPFGFNGGARSPFRDPAVQLVTDCMSRFETVQGNGGTSSVRVSTARNRDSAAAMRYCMTS